MARTLVNSFATTQVKVMRRRVMQHDLDMYAAISGKAPALKEEAKPSEQAVRVATAARAKPWSASVLASYLNHIRAGRLAGRVVPPEMTEWVRKLSIHALGRLQEAQDRLTAARSREGPVENKPRAA